MMNRLWPDKERLLWKFFNDCEDNVDFVFGSIGGGGLDVWYERLYESVSPHTKMIGVEPAGAASMKNRSKIITLHGLKVH